MKGPLMGRRFGFNVLEFTPRGTLRRSRCVLNAAFARSQVLTDPVDLLPSGRHAEILGTLKYCSPCRCHRRSSPTRFGLDAGWGSGRLHCGQSRCGQTESRETPFYYVVRQAYPATSYPILPKVSITSTRVM